MTAALCVSPATADVLILSPTADASVDMFQPDLNDGASDALSVRNRFGPPQVPANWERDALIRFDLSVVPADAEVLGATLGLYYYGALLTDPAGRELACHRVGSDWDEDTITWRTRPVAEFTATSVCVVPPEPGAWMEWDVTSDVRAVVNGSAYDHCGWQISDQQTWGLLSIPTVYFRSREFGELTPYLRVVVDNGRVHASLDIKPGCCPNSFNPTSRGVLPVALSGTDDFDVRLVDVSSIRLSRADGIGGSVAPHEGPPGPHSEFEDVATPFDGRPCDSRGVEGDGIVDLSLKFSTPEVIEALELNDLALGAEFELVVTGDLLDGRRFEARDYIRLGPHDKRLDASRLGRR